MCVVNANSPSFNDALERARARLLKVKNTLMKFFAKRLLHRVIDGVLKEYNIDANTPIELELAKEIELKIRIRLAYIELGVPYQEILSENNISRLFQDSADINN